MNIKIVLSSILILFLYSCGGGGGENSDQLQLNINYPPTISGTISNTRVGETFSFTPTTFDSNGDTLTFSISEKPGWLTFDDSTGSLNGIAPEETLGRSYTFTITVTDGQNQASLGPLSFSVTPLEFSCLYIHW